MPQKMSLLGVGPKIVKPVSIYIVLSLIITLIFPKIFIMHFLPTPFFHIIGALLLGFGLGLQFLSALAMRRAVLAGRLETKFIFALTRNPIYFNAIFFILPGLAILLKSWLIFGASFYAYCRFKKHIHLEEELLENYFGLQYIEYKRNTPRFWPTRKSMD